MRDARLTPGPLTATQADSGGSGVSTARLAGTLLAVGLLLRLGLAVGTHVSPLRGTVFAEADAVAYDTYGRLVAEAWRRGQSYDLAEVRQHIHLGYFWYIAGLYWLFGPVPILPKLLNAFIGTGAAGLLYLATRRAFGETPGLVALVLALFFPSHVFWATQNLKDPMILLAYAAVAWALVGVGDGARLAPALAGGAALLALGTVRTYAVFQIGLAVGAALLAARSDRRRLLLGLGILTVLLGGLFVAFRAWGTLEWNYLASVDLGMLQRVRRAGALGGSVFMPQADVSTPGRLLTFLPLGFLFATLAPFPVFGHSLILTLSIPEMLAWYAFLPAVVAAAVRWRRSEPLPIAFLVTFILVSLLTFGLFQANAGSLFRQRAPVTLLTFILVGAAFAEPGAPSRSGPAGDPAAEPIPWVRRRGARIGKRALDLVLAGAALVLLSPLFLLIAVAIVLDSGRPVFYVAPFSAYRQSLFPMIKFRTMTPGADGDRREFAYRQDPRITCVGHWLRRLSLDELPQLWNVLLGQMSLVGPRPTFPWRMREADAEEQRRYLMPPGLTGWEQVNGRNSVLWKDAVRLDVEYVDRWSLPMDLRILWRTLGVVVTGRGLYYGEREPGPPGCPKGDR